MTLIPAINAPGLTPDPSALALPINAFQQALARLDHQTGIAAGTNNGYLTAAYTGKSRKNASGYLLNRKNGQVSAQYPIPPITASDASFNGEPVLAPTATTQVVQSEPGTAHPSCSALLIFTPPAGAATQLVNVFDNVSHTVFQAIMSTTQLQIATDVTGGSAYNVNIDRGLIGDGRPNFLLMCADAVSRQVAVYLNSKTPILSATGLNPATWTSYATGCWRFGAFGAVGARFSEFAGFDRSLHHDAVSQPMISGLIDAAKTAYPNIVLV